jgi:hypothetical protein
MSGIVLAFLILFGKVYICEQLSQKLLHENKEGVM